MFIYGTKVSSSKIFQVISSTDLISSRVLYIISVVYRSAVSPYISIISYISYFHITYFIFHISYLVSQILRKVTYVSIAGAIFIVYLLHNLFQARSGRTSRRVGKCSDAGATSTYNVPAYRSQVSFSIKAF